MCAAAVMHRIGRGTGAEDLGARRRLDVAQETFIRVRLSATLRVRAEEKLRNSKALSRCDAERPQRGHKRVPVGGRRTFVRPVFECLTSRSGMIRPER